MKVLLKQYIEDFNDQATQAKFLTHKDVIGLTNKIKLIRSQPFNELSSLDLNVFLSNLYNVLIQMGDAKTEMLEGAVDFFVACLNCKETRDTMLRQKHFLSILIQEISSYDEEDKVLRLLTVIRELVKRSNELDEHNLKLIVEALRELTEQGENKDILEISLEIMTSLCLECAAAKYLITRVIKVTSVRQKAEQIGNSLVLFKFFMVVEDEINPTDFRYFTKFAIKDIRVGLDSFSTVALVHSSDIVTHIRKHNLTVDFGIGSDEELSKLMEDLIHDLTEKISLDFKALVKSQYFDEVFLFFTNLLKLDKTLISMLETFTESAFLSPDISRTTNALNFYLTYVQLGGSKATSDVVVENIIEFFTGNQQNEDYDRSAAFLRVLATIEEQGKLGERHLQTINAHFDTTLNYFKAATLSTLEDGEIYLFIHLLASLASFARTRPIFRTKLNEVLILEFVPLLVVKGFLSRKKNILTLLMQLCGVENFPMDKVASIWSRSSLHLTHIGPSEDLRKSLQRRESNSRSTRLINERVNKDLDVLINRVNESLDNKDFDSTTAGIIEGYRQKIKFLNYQLLSISTSLEVRSAETSKQQQTIETLVKQAETQDFLNWSLELDKELCLKDIKKLKEEHAQTMKTVTDFQERLLKVEEKRRINEKLFAVKAKELEQIKAAKALAEQKLETSKKKLQATQEENEKRILELKQEIEQERKAKEDLIAHELAEHKKLQQRLSTSENDKLKLQEVIKLHESEIERLQEKNQQCEADLKEAEQMKNTIMQLMQGRSSRK